MNKLRDILTCLIAFVAVTIVDYSTGYEITSFPLYLIPIVLTVFYFGPEIAWIMVVCSTIAWSVNDYLTGNVYSYEGVRYWNIFVRFITYALAVYGLGVYHATLETHRKRLDNLRRLLPICSSCGKIMWKDGKWKTPEEILETVESAQNSIDCPTCKKHA